MGLKKEIREMETHVIRLTRKVQQDASDALRDGKRVIIQGIASLRLVEAKNHPIQKNPKLIAKNLKSER